MLKCLFVAFVLIVPIFSKRLPNFKNIRRSIIEGIPIYMQDIGYVNNFSERCESVSSAADIDVDLNKLESLYETYDDCASGVGDYEQFYREASAVLTSVWKVPSGSILHLSDKEKTEIVAFLQIYCPKVINYVKCDDVISPIYEHCYTIAERNRTSVGKASFIQMFENFCENNVEQLVKVVNTEGFECGITKGFSCFREYRISSDPFSYPSLRDFCRFYNMTLNCMGPVFKECELSETPDTLMRSFFTNIQAETICDDLLLKDNRKSFISNSYSETC